jgi:hypothetical protein
VIDDVASLTSAQSETTVLDLRPSVALSPSSKDAGGWSKEARPTNTFTLPTERLMEIAQGEALSRSFGPIQAFSSSRRTPATDTHLVPSAYPRKALRELWWSQRKLNSFG